MLLVTLCLIWSHQLQNFWGRLESGRFSCRKYDGDGVGNLVWSPYVMGRGMQLQCFVLQSHWGSIVMARRFMLKQPSIPGRKRGQAGVVLA